MEDKERMAAENHYSRETGIMPAEGYLAANYVPIQKENSPRYTKEDALKNGTLYPGLNLPYKNFVPKKEIANTTEGQLMSIDFALWELGLYLDMHPSDTEALKLRNALLSMSKEATEAFEKERGPLTHRAEMDGRYTWVNSPWPWEK